jgi:hypothetical protein
MRKLNAMLTPLIRSSIGSFEFADGTTRRRTRAATINSKAANDEASRAWRVAT